MDPAAAAAAAAEKKELDAIAALLLKGVDKREVTESGRRVPMFKGKVHACVVCPFPSCVAPPGPLGARHWLGRPQHPA